MKIQIEYNNKCWFWHRWNREKDTGINKYEKCLKCGSKRVISDDKSGYQPIDKKYFIDIL